MNTVIIADDEEEKILLTHVVQQAGLSIRPTSNFTTLLQDWNAAPVDLVILAQSSEQLPEAVRQMRLVTAAALIVIVDFINDDVRVALYKAGADLVLVRPYSPRLLIVQAGIMAQQGFSRSLYRLPKQSATALPVESFVPPSTQAGKGLLYYIVNI